MKRIVSVLLALALILSASAALAGSFQQAYYNEDYAYLDDPESVYVSLTLEEAYYLLQQEGNYLILLGGSWCGNTTPVIGYINEGLLATPYNESYNLENYDALVAEAEANKEAGETAKEHESH